MKTLITVLALTFNVPNYEPMRSTGQCDYNVSDYGHSCMPVITRTRILMVAA